MFNLLIVDFISVFAYHMSVLSTCIILVFHLPFKCFRCQYLTDFQAGVEVTAEEIEQTVNKVFEENKEVILEQRYRTNG